MKRSSFMRPPEPEKRYEVGDRVEAYCDHEKNGQRVKGWIKGTVVSLDEKNVAVQFRTTVYLTDGWMVPDHILWFPFESENIRPVKPRSRSAEQVTPDML